MENNEIFYDIERKLQYVIKKLKLKNGDIAEKLGMSSGLISQIQNSVNVNKLKKCHLYAICYAYNIPIEIFENKNIKTSNMVDELLEQKITKKSIFKKNYRLLNKLVGEWYLYSYPSNINFSKDGIWKTKTTIYEDATVKDEHNNWGNLFIGEKQSIIIKESHNSKNLTSITFDNDRVTYENFIFSRVSKSNILNKELFNFGFFSKREIETDKVKKILGKIEKVQLQMEYDMIEKVNSCIRIEG